MRHFVGALLLGFALSGCGGGTEIIAPAHAAATETPASGATPSATPSSPATLPSATPGPQITPSASALPPGGASSASIYLGDIAQGAVLIYSSNANGSVSPSAIIAGSNTGFSDSTGTSPIYGIAVDAAGTVYILTQTTDATQTSVSAESILAFPAGTTGNVAPARTISLPTSIDAQSLACSGSNLYVTDDAGSGAVDVYAASASGSTMPARTFTDSTAFADPPLKVSVDATGDTYVATYDPSAATSAEETQGVFEFLATANGSITPAGSLSGTNTTFGDGILDAAVIDPNGRIDAVLQDSTSDVVADIAEFDAGAGGNTAPQTSFRDTSSQGPVDAALDSAGNFYVSEIANSTSYAQVNVFAPGAKAPQQTILAYGAVLPLIAIGPYVGISPSASMPFAAHHKLDPGTVYRRFLRLRTTRNGLSRLSR
jgi:hypothetical protein